MPAGQDAPGVLLVGLGGSAGRKLGWGQGHLGALARAGVGSAGDPLPGRLAGVAAAARWAVSSAFSTGISNNEQPFF